ncbi:unnamed protein product, partial [Nesidiocoris tenuis]
PAQPYRRTRRPPRAPRPEGRQARAPGHRCLGGSTKDLLYAGLNTSEKGFQVVATCCPIEQAGLISKIDFLKHLNNDCESKGCGHAPLCAAKGKYITIELHGSLQETHNVRSPGPYAALMSTYGENTFISLEFHALLFLTVTKKTQSQTRKETQTHYRSRSQTDNETETPPHRQNLEVELTMEQQLKLEAKLTMNTKLQIIINLKVKLTKKQRANVPKNDDCEKMRRSVCMELVRISIFGEWCESGYPKTSGILLQPSIQCGRSELRPQQNVDTRLAAMMYGLNLSDANNGPNMTTRRELLRRSLVFPNASYSNLSANFGAIIINFENPKVLSAEERNLTLEGKNCVLSIGLNLENLHLIKITHIFQDSHDPAQVNIGTYIDLYIGILYYRSEYLVQYNWRLFSSSNLKPDMVRSMRIYRALTQTVRHWENLRRGQATRSNTKFRRYHLGTCHCHGRVLLSNAALQAAQMSYYCGSRDLEFIQSGEDRALIKSQQPRRFPASCGFIRRKSRRRRYTIGWKFSSDPELEKARTTFDTPTGAGSRLSAKAFSFLGLGPVPRPPAGQSQKQQRTSSSLGIRGFPKDGPKAVLTTLWPHRQQWLAYVRADECEVEMFPARRLACVQTIRTRNGSLSKGGSPTAVAHDLRGSSAIRIAAWSSKSGRYLELGAIVILEKAKGSDRANNQPLIRGTLPRQRNHRPLRRITSAPPSLPTIPQDLTSKTRRITRISKPKDCLHQIGGPLILIKSHPLRGFCRNLISEGSSLKAHPFCPSGKDIERSGKSRFTPAHPAIHLFHHNQVMVFVTLVDERRRSTGAPRVIGSGVNRTVNSRTPNPNEPRTTPWRGAASTSTPQFINPPMFPSFSQKLVIYPMEKLPIFPIRNFDSIDHDVRKDEGSNFENIFLLLPMGRQEPTLPPWRHAALPEPEPGGAEPGNPSPSINDITSRPDQHGGISDQPPGTAQQAVGATIPRIYDPRACSFV